MVLDLSKYVTWPEFIEFVNSNSQFKLIEIGHNWLSIGGKLPYSVNEPEFNWIKGHIVERRYTHGFDLATGCGVSALAIAYATMLNHGKTLSMDSYHEELTQHIPVGTSSGDIKTNATGYQLASWFKQTFGLDNLTLEVGWSPNDATTYIKGYLDSRVDFAVLDCPKSDADLARDLTMLKPFLAPRYSIFIHDIQAFGNGEQVARDILGVPYERYFAKEGLRYPIGRIVQG